MEIKFEDVNLYSNDVLISKKKIIDNLNLEIPEKSITALYGDYNKSMIALLISALIKPDSGIVKVGKHILKKDSHLNKINDLRFEVGYAPSDPRKFLFKQTVKQEIEYGMKHYKYHLNRLKERPLDALKLVGLDNSYEKRNPYNLSLSEQKKVMIASIIAYNPKVLIFDEIEKGLNNIDRNSIIRLIKLLKNKYNRTIILISNDINFLFQCIDNIYVINDGKLVFNCTKKDLYNRNIERYIEVPKIIEFVKQARIKGSKIEDYYDINELIKGVFRDVE